MKAKVGILDYGVGNIASLDGVLQKLGYQVKIGNTESSLSGVKAIFLPGVGSFDFAMQNLDNLNMMRFLRDRFEAQDINIIGICLGMQILFEHSEEGNCSGLGLIKGRVKRFSDKECHVGWNIASASSDFLLSGESGYYFNHSYYVECDEDVVIAHSEYQLKFPVMVNKKKFFGVQFHPEKSQHTGEKLLKTLVDLD